MEKKIEEFRYLWDGTGPQWALMNIGSNFGSPEYLVMNVESKSALIIEDDSLANHVIERMLSAGVRVISVQT